MPLSNTYVDNILEAGTAKEEKHTQVNPQAIKEVRGQTSLQNLFLFYEQTTTNKKAGSKGKRAAVQAPHKILGNASVTGHEKGHRTVKASGTLMLGAGSRRRLQTPQNMRAHHPVSCGQSRCLVFIGE